jgi:hypothetical protein
MDIHLVLPHIHHINTAKQAISTFKEHFIAELATVNKDCPLHGKNFTTGQNHAQTLLLLAP